MSTIPLILSLLAGFLLGFGFYVLLRASSLSERHRRNIRSAWAVRERLNRIASGKPPYASKTWLLTYLRQIDPYVFEELVLICLKEQGYIIRRNRRYSGDGGVDGRAGKDGRFYLIQCKRYGSYIKGADVEALEALCEKKGCDGLFVHTGIPGKKNTSPSGRVRTVCGMELYSLVIDGGKKIES